MILLRRVLWLASVCAAFSAAAFANKCVCVTLSKDACGSCEDSACGGNVCALRKIPNQAAGWNQLVPGFSLEEVAGRTLVSSVLPSAPAAQAGMHIGDEVVSIDGMQLPLCSNEAKAWQNPSTTHSILVRRRGKAMLLEVAPVRVSALQKSVTARLQDASFTDESRMLPAWAPFLSELVLSTDGRSLTVAAVLPASSAAENRIAPGDVIVSAEGITLADVASLEGAPYRSELKLHLSGPSGDRIVRLPMKSLSEMMNGLSREKTETPALSKGM